MGNTPLFDAVRAGHSVLAQTLVAKGARLALSESDAAGELCERARNGDLERIRLLLRLIEDEKSDGGCGINLRAEEAAGVLSTVPLHDPVVTERLMREWVNARFSLQPEQPVDDIRDCSSRARAKPAAGSRAAAACIDWARVLTRALPRCVVRRLW